MRYIGPRPCNSNEEEDYKRGSLRRFGKARIYEVIVMALKGKLVYDLPGSLIRFPRPAQDRSALVQRKQVAGPPRVCDRETGGNGV